MDSEINKLFFAEKCRKKGTHGFQGCVNFGKGCKESGYYLVTYSKEGLCHDCELKQFPERWYGCIFCRKAINFNNACHSCEQGFKSWASEFFKIMKKHPKSKINETEDRRSFIHDTRYVRYLITDNDQAQKLPFLVAERPDYWGQWPGFHVGGLKWVKPDPHDFDQPIDMSDMISENFIKVYVRELEKFGIFIYNDVQILPIENLTNKSCKV